METVVITGANRGIGLQLTKQFLLTGKRVIATCRDLDKAQGLKSLQDQGELTIHSLEVTSEQSVADFCSNLQDKTIDILINNAGIIGGDKQDSEKMDYQAWADCFAVNCMAPFRLSSALKTNLLMSARPRIISISSMMASLMGEGVGSFAYRSSKAALNKTMQVLALEYSNDDIVVCPVHPGWVQTEMGGPDAELTVQQCALGLVSLINGLTLEHSGRFWQWDGQELVW